MPVIPDASLESAALGRSALPSLALLRLTRFLRRTGIHFAGKRYEASFDGIL
jgi:hypothetical protein